MRIIAHNLTIEKGRYTDIPRHDRMCKVCNIGLAKNEQFLLVVLHICSSGKFSYNIKAIRHKYAYSSMF